MNKLFNAQIQFMAPDGELMEAIKEVLKPVFEIAETEGHISVTVSNHDLLYQAPPVEAEPCCPEGEVCEEHEEVKEEEVDNTEEVTE